MWECYHMDAFNWTGPPSAKITLYRNLSKAAQMVCICKGSSDDLDSCYFCSEKILSTKYDSTSSIHNGTVLQNKTSIGFLKGCKEKKSRKRERLEKCIWKCRLCTSTSFYCAYLIPIILVWFTSVRM